MSKCNHRWRMNYVNGEYVNQTCDICGEPPVTKLPTNQTTQERLREIIDEFKKFVLGEQGLTDEQAEQQLLQLIETEIIGDMEQRETEDMSLKSWTPEDYKAFGRNELRAEQRTTLRGKK